MKHIKNYFNFLFFLLLFTHHTRAQAERVGLANEAWKTIKTEHFDVIFTAKQQDLGLYYANVAEKAYENLATVFINRTERVIIVVNDTTDVSNGYASRIPYAHIMAYSVPIGSHESLSEAGDWARELITHELTHILQFEPALGIYKYIRPIFGTIVAPNLLMPLWWKEGMAVEMETQFSPGGRSRSHFQDASLRAFVMDKKLFQYTISQANEVLPSWPYGSRPYLFGSLFWESLVRDTKIESVNTLVSRQGQRVPYAIESPMREITGRTYDEQYTKALMFVEENATQQLTKLKEQPLDTIETLKISGQSSYSPRWSEDLKILAYIEQVESKGYLSFKNESGETLNLKKRPSEISGLEFMPHAKKILYSKVDDINSKYKISDLHIYDLEAEKSERLTTNQRAREASFSDDGKRIVFVSTDSGRTQIKILDIQSKEIKTLISSHFKERFQSPIFWSENDILFSKVSENGQQKIYKFAISEKKETTLPLNFEGIRFLRKKKNELYFTSYQNGVNNVYVTQDLTTATPVTHVPIGVWSFDVDPTNHKIWATNITSEGFAIAALELKKRPPLPVIENKRTKHYKFTDHKTPHKDYGSEDYTASSYLLPTYWLPFVTTSTNSRGVYFQAQTSGHDPINEHEYSVLGSYDTDLQKGGFQGFYINSATSVPVQMAATVHNQALGTNENIVETKTGSLGILPDMFKLSKNLTFQTGVEYQQTEINGSQTQHWGPSATLQYVDYDQNIFQISPQNGWGAYLKYVHWKNLKDSRDYNKALVSLVGYYSPWLPKHHTMMTRVSTLMTFESVPARFGTSNDSQFLNSDVVIPQFVLRGYSPSQFYGRSIWNTNWEYRFPIATLEKGTGTYAYFLKRLSGAVVVDGLGVEGGSITEDNAYQKRYLNESFWSSGLEIKLETTIGYVLPMNFVLGAYLPHSPLFRSSAQIGINIQVGGF